MLHDSQYLSLPLTIYRTVIHELFVHRSISCAKPLSIQLHLLLLLPSMTANCAVFVVTCSSFAATISQLLIGQLGVTFGQNNACFDWLSSHTLFSRKKKIDKAGTQCVHLWALLLSPNNTGISSLRPFPILLPHFLQCTIPYPSKCFY